MALRRFWIESSDMTGDQVQLHGDLFHHILDVCRFETGDRFEVMPGDGNAYLVEISEMGKRELRGRIFETRVVEPLRKPWIHLAVSVPRYPKVDFIVEKCVELGVHTLSLFISEFSFPRELKDLSENRMQRWEKINRSAAQQSGRGTLMEISKPERLEDLLRKMQSQTGVLGLFPYEGDAAIGWKAAIAEAKKRSPDEIWVFVGSEGGFSKREVELFQQFGLAPMTMGSQILRVETACVALVSVIKYEFEV